MMSLRNLVRGEDFLMNAFSQGFPNFFSLAHLEIDRIYVFFLIDIVNLKYFKGTAKWFSYTYIEYTFSFFLL